MPIIPVPRRTNVPGSGTVLTLIVVPATVPLPPLVENVPFRVPVRVPWAFVDDNGTPK